jgi:ribulose-phosphate 3-epimerase
MVDVIPAIIPESFEDLQDKMSLVNGLTKMVQIDACDGKFVPSKCWPYINDHDGDFRNITEEEAGFPFWHSLDFEVDLMVSHPENVVEDWIRAGVKRIVLHIESAPHIKDLIKDLRTKYGWYGESPLTIEIGIALNPNTSNEKIFEYLDPNTEGRSLVDFVQFMGIREIGYQGQLFDERVFGKIRTLRQSYPDAIISVDGGVTLENAHDIVEAGVNRLVSGSAIYGSEDIKEAIEKLKGL